MKKRICEQCGGSILQVDDSFICSHCNTIYDKVFSLNDNIQLLLNSADTLRRNKRFIEAKDEYSNILSIDNSVIDAYWGRLLSDLGIEYVLDYQGLYVPTCHRLTFYNIMDHDDFKYIENNADVDSFSHYFKRAQVIESIRLKLISQTDKLELYDIFICFKNLDSEGKPTTDSIHARELYDALTNKGYKVFLSTISLKNVSGSDYEPIIFSAINSAKVLITITSKKQYLESPWVKNEWSRFKDLIQKGQKQLGSIIPVYYDMTPNDFPIELCNIQGLHLTNVTFFDTLINTLENFDFSFNNKKNKNKEVNIKSDRKTNKKKKKSLVTKITKISVKVKKNIAKFFRNFIKVLKKNRKKYFKKNITIIFSSVVSIMILFFILILPLILKENIVYEYIDGGRITFDTDTGTILEFNSNNRDTSVVIPYSIEGITVKSIKSLSFSNQKIESIEIPSTVTKIEKNAFLNSFDFYKYNDINGSFITIDGDSNRFNDSWEIIGFPKLLYPGIVNYNGIIFDDRNGEIIDYSVTQKNSLIIPESINNITVEIIGESAFYEKGIVSVEIPATVTIIKDFAFQHNDLTSITIPESVISIGENAFWLNAFNNVNIEGETSRFNIKWNMIGFPGRLLDGVILNNGIYFDIENQCIVDYDSSYSETVIIPTLIDGVVPIKVIAKHAFYSKNIKNVTISENIVLIENFSFFYNNLNEITILGEETRFNENWEAIGFPLSLKPLN